MNTDGVLTISDVLLWAKWLWSFPAKLVMEVVAGSPKLATFFEIDCGTGEGWGGAVFAFFIWFIAINLLRFATESKS